MTAGAHEHSSLADEAARLVEAFSEMASGWSGTAGSPGQRPTELPASCLLCPLCQVIARLQDSRPEVVGHLADATSSLAAALGELASTREEASDPRPGREETQHIDIGD